MRRQLGMVSVLLVSALVLGACSGRKNNEESSSSRETTSSVKAGKSSRAESESKTGESSKKQTAASSSSAASSAGEESKAPQNEVPSLDLNSRRLAAFNKTMKSRLGNAALPGEDGLGSAPGYLNVRFSGDADNFSVDYIVSYNPYDINSQATAGHVPYATFSKKTYDSEDAAANDVPYQPADSQSALPKVSLGHNIYGLMDSGAGQRYLQWNEGRWSMLVHATAVSGEDPVPTAQHVVDLLEQYFLPAPSSRGGGQFELNTGENTLTWNKGNVLYTLKGKSIDTLVKMAASIK